MEKTFNTVISSISLMWSIANITEMVSFILLILTVINILWNLIYKIYKCFKDKKLEDIGKHINDTIDELEKFKNTKGDDTNVNI